MERTDSAEKILFFDIGGVLLSNGWGHESRDKAAKEFGLDYDEMNALHGFYFNLYEGGRINLDQYLDGVVFNRPKTFTKEVFTAFMFAQSVELPGMVPWLAALKQQTPGLRIFSINNEGRELNNYRIEKFNLHRCFHGFISSCEVGLSKPDPAIFTLALGIVQAKPGHCYYFDDRSILAEAAAKVGIQAHQHKNFDDTKSIVERILAS